MKATSGVTGVSLRWKLWLTARLKVTQECSKGIQGQPSRMLAPFLFFSSQTRDSSQIMQSLSFHFLDLFSTCWLDWACVLDKTVYKKQIESITWFPWERSMALPNQGLKVFVWWCKLLFLLASLKCFIKHLRSNAGQLYGMERAYVKWSMTGNRSVFLWWIPEKELA